MNKKSMNNHRQIDEKNAYLKEEKLIEKRIVKKPKNKFGSQVKSLLDAKQLAIRLGLSPWTIRKWRAEERIPYIRLGRAVRYNFDEVVSSLSKGS